MVEFDLTTCVYSWSDFEPSHFQLIASILFTLVQHQQFYVTMIGQASISRSELSGPDWTVFSIGMCEQPVGVWVES